MPFSLWLAAALSGILLAASFPPIGLWPLAWIALVPLLWAVSRSREAKEAANLGAFSGLFFYGVALRWLPKIFGPFAAAFWCVFALFLALYGAMIWSAQKYFRRPAALIAATAIFWTGIEYFRSEVWALNCSMLALGYSQARAPILLQSCALWGLYGLSGAIAAANMAFLRARGKAAVVSASAFLLLWAWGARRAAIFPAEEGRALSVALVQDESYDLNRLVGLSLSPSAKNADLLVWPEYAFTVAAGREESYRRFLAQKLKGTSAVSVLGAAIFPEDMKKGREQNFAWALSPGGELLGRYDKLHPIPYVERLLPPNPAPRPVDTPIGRLGIQICYDLDFENGTRLMANQGAEILVVPNIDPAEWGKAEHAQHSAMSAARAIESGLWIVRAASSGLSQIIDPVGRVRAELPAGASGILAGTAYIRKPAFFYRTIGWLAGPLCLAAALTAILVMLRDYFSKTRKTAATISPKPAR